MSLNMIPTHYPLEDILEAYEKEQEEDDITFSVLTGQPFDICAEKPIGFIDSTEMDTDALVYELEQDETPHEVNRTTFVCTDTCQSQSHFALLQPTDKVKKTWYNHLTKLNNKVDATFASDHTCYRLESTIQNLQANIIQATYLAPLEPLPLDTPSYFPLEPDLKIQANLPSGLDIKIMIDTGSHKTILNRKFLQKHPSHFQNFTKVPLEIEHKIKLPTGQIIMTDGMIALPVVINGHLFNFLVLVTSFSENFELVLGIEGLIQLESSLYLADSTLYVQPRSIPLYLDDDIVVPPQETAQIVLHGDLPNTFSSGFAVIHVPTLDPSYSILTTDVEFINQCACFLLSNHSKTAKHFTANKPLAHFDTHSIGHYNPLVATQILETREYIYPSSNAALISESIHDIQTHSEPPMDTKNP